MTFSIRVASVLFSLGFQIWDWRLCQRGTNNAIVTGVATSMALAAIHGIALERRVRPVNTHLLYHCRRGNEGNDWSGKKNTKTTWFWSLVWNVLGFSESDKCSVPDITHNQIILIKFSLLLLFIFLILHPPHMAVVKTGGRNENKLKHCNNILPLAPVWAQLTK